MGIPKLTKRWTAPSKSPQWTPDFPPASISGRSSWRHQRIWAPRMCKATWMHWVLFGGKQNTGYICFEDIWRFEIWVILQLYVEGFTLDMFGIWFDICLLFGKRPVQLSMHTVCIYVFIRPLFLFVRVEHNWQPHWILWTLPKPGIQAQDLHKRSCAFQLQIDQDITTWNVDLFYQRNTWRNIYTVYTYIETVYIYINNQ